MYCNKCGKVVNEGSSFCNYCGYEIIIPKDSIDIVPKIDSNIDSSMKCPLCNNSNASYKVSAIYSNGISTGSYSGTSVSLITPFSSKESSSIAITPVNLTGVNISELSNKLSPPVKPGSYSTGSCLMVFLIFIPIFTGLFFLVTSVFTLMFAPTTIRVIIAIVFFVVELIIILAIRKGIRGIGKQAELNKKDYNNSLKNWQNECSQWENLFYCFKHDIVFDPSSGEHAPANNLNKIYKKYINAEYKESVVLDNLRIDDEELKFYDAALRLNPRNADTWYKKGLALDNLGEYDKAIECYDECIKINPDNADAWYRKSLSLDKLGDYEEELKCYNEAKRINPEIY